MMKVTRIALTFPKIIEDLKAVKYTQDLTGCAFDQRSDPPTCVAFPGTRVNNFTDGVFEDPMGQQGSVFTPTAPLPPGSPGFDINRILSIKWCPNQNYFRVMVAGDGPYTLPLTPAIFKTKAELRAAVQEYDADPTAAIKKYGPIADWDVSAITDMYRLFNTLENFNADISNWDTSSVTDMSWMFYVRSSPCPAPNLQ